MSSRVSRAIEHRINFGDYEGVTLSASVEADCDEGAEQKTLGKLADLLVNALDDEIVQARKYAINDSYIHEWDKEY